ncbi:MAG: TonB-dependent receptor [Candidatus Aminicenantes bacterium]|nr:MAG: TonB-dependent receptor [Candidatus Aminicenantes bacterium]
MKKKSIKIFLIIYLPIIFASLATAQRQTGSIKAKITDTEGFPLPGAFVYLSSPALLGMQTYITSDTGRIKFFSLPPGRYKIMAEMPGFKTVNIEDIIVSVGMTTTLYITLEKTTIEEEITTKLTSPTGDQESAKTAVIIEKDILKNIPLDRDLHDIINSVAGIISEGIPYQQTSIIHGSTSRANIYALDSTYINDPRGMHLSTNINFDILEEIELETAAHPAELGPIDGGFINIITKSGGNDFSGHLSLFHTSDDFASTFWTEEELSAMEASPAPMDTKLWDFSLTLGGSLLVDKMWFFGNLRYISQSQTTSFIPWTDPQGNKHEEFDWSNKEKMGFFKLTSKFDPKLKISGMFNYSNTYQPIYNSSLDWNLTEEATRILDHGKHYLLNGALNYIMNQNTFVDVKTGYTHHRLPLFLNEEGKNNPQFFDESTGHLWGSALFNETQLTKRFQTEASITHYADSFLGGHHEFKAGGEYEYIYGEWSAWKENNLLIDYYFGSPYYFGLDESPSTGNTVGKGKIHFTLASKEKGGLIQKSEVRRFGFFVQDSIIIAERLTLNLGIRFDRSAADQPAIFKTESGNAVSYKLGEELISPTYGVNPFGQNEVEGQKRLIAWNSLSPRFGLIFDIFGKGKTIFKTSFSRYSDYLMLQYLTALNPLYFSRSHQFYWYDENMDGEVDDSDTYALYPEDYRLYDPEYIEKRIAPDLKSSYTDEFTIGLHQELIPDLSIRVNYIYKYKRNIIENVRYAPDLEKDWYTIDQDTERWWTPFNTVIPGVDDYPDTPVTVYYWSKNAPLFFDRIKNVPELKRNYQALEIQIKKRMSNNWQLYGAMVLSKATGNIGLGYGASSVFTSAANSPNYFENYPEGSRLDFDRSLLIKLMGTYRFPFDFFLSFYYTHMSGIPWARRVTIIPPSSWALEENVYRSYANVLLEEPGTRRNKSYDNLDIRITKELSLGNFGRLTAYIDIIDALGNKYRSIAQNDGGYWFPADENTVQGIRILSPNYTKTTSLSGVRLFRFSLCLSF